jgi:putative ABC transport system permease protein
MARRPSLADRVYRLLLLAYPRAIRRECGDDMVQLFADCRRAARETGGRRRLWWPAIVDIARHASHERLLQTRRAVRTAGRALLAENWRRSVKAIRQDVRYAARVFVRTPAMSLVAVATLALGIGANTAIFSFADALLVRPLPVRDPGRLMALLHVARDSAANFSSFSYPDYLDIRDRPDDGLALLAAWSTIQVELGGREVEHADAQIVSDNYFETMGVRPLIGRVFRAADTGPLVVLSEAFWRRRFGADPGAIGRTLDIDGTPFTIVGVVPGGFRGLDFASAPVLWVPLATHDVTIASFHAFGIDLFGNRGTHWLELVGRLDGGATPARTLAALRAIADRQAKAHPDTNQAWTIALVPAADVRLGNPGDRPVVRLTVALVVVVGLVLAIACANVANLLLVRAASRRREMAIRLAVGASRLRLVRQLLTESLLLALGGGVAGTTLAMAAMHVLFRQEISAWLPGLDVRLDARVLAFALSASVVTGAVFGLVPALQASKVDVAGALKAGQWRARRAAGRSGVRNLLVAVQVALCLVLLVGAGLTLRTILNLRSVPLGFDPANLSVVRVDLSGRGYSGDRGRALFARLTDRLRAMPGVEDAAVGLIAPFNARRAANDIFWEAADGSGERRRTNVDLNMVGPGYFETMRIPVVLGRGFRPSDATRSPGAAVVNSTLARQLWPHESPLGKRLWSWGGQDPDVPLEVVGVVADGRYYRSWRTAGRPFLFLAFPQWYAPAMAVHVRTAPGSPLREADVRRDVAALDASLPPADVRRVSDAMAESMVLERTGAGLLGGFGALALVIATLGVYGVVASTVAARTQEIGLRMALGASRPVVLRQVVGRSVVPVLVGVGIGWLVSLGLTRLIAGLLYQVGPDDPVTFAGVAVLLVAAGIVAGSLPARRATRVDPLTVLRGE